MLHECKILPEHFNNILAGLKSFEIRKDDRDPPTSPATSSCCGSGVMEPTPVAGYAQTSLSCYGASFAGRVTAL